MSARAPLEPDIPAVWLEPVFHSVYLQAMVNWGKSNSASPCSIGSKSNMGIFVTAMHSLLRVHNLLRQVGFPPSPQSGFDFGFSVPPAAHGAMGQAAITSEDIGQTFKAIAEYTPMRNNLFKYAWKENQDAGSIFIRPLFDIGAYGD